MSSVSSNQLCVYEEAGYDEVFPLGHNNPGTSSEERNLSVTSPSTRDEDLDMDRLEGDSTDGLIGAELPTQSVIGPDGFREFIILPLWTVNDFISTIKESHFKMLREKYQIPDHIPLRLPYKSEKCYYEGVEGVRVYGQMLKAGLRFPLSALHHRLLQYLRLAVTQIAPITWRVFLGVEVLFKAMSKGARRLTVKEFFHCYCLTEIVQSKGMYSFMPWSSLLRLVCDTPDSNIIRNSHYFFMEGNEWMCHPSDQEFLPVDKTWGIMPPSGMHSSVFKFFNCVNSFITLTISFCSLGPSTSLP